jgi:hypothetical protein
MDLIYGPHYGPQYCGPYLGPTADYVLHSPIWAWKPCLALGL